jgi:hypothetical protein
MKNLIIYFIGVFAGLALIAGCGMNSDSVEFGEDDELIVDAGDLDVYFELIEPISETYMVFGGQHVKHNNAVGSVTLATLSMADAILIYDRYPDFHRCSSPGAVQAKKAVNQMNIVAADSDVLEALKAVLSEHNDSIRQGGDRVCVRLDGAVLEMTAAVVRAADEDIMDDLPRQARTNFFYVESAEIVDAQSALEGS